MTKSKQPNSKTHVGFRIDSDLKHNLELKSMERNINLTKVIEDALWQYIKDEPPKLDEYILKDARNDLITGYNQDCNIMIPRYMGGVTYYQLQTLLAAYSESLKNDLIKLQQVVQTQQQL